MGQIKLSGPDSANAGDTLRYDAAVSNGPKGQTVTLVLEGAPAAPPSRTVMLDSQGGGSTHFDVTFAAASTTVIALTCHGLKGKMAPDTKPVTVIAPPLGFASPRAAPGAAAGPGDWAGTDQGAAKGLTWDPAAQRAGCAKTGESNPDEGDR